MNLCNIYEFAADNVTTNTTVKRTPTALTINVVKTCGLPYINNPPLSRVCQSATAKQYQTRQTSTKDAIRLTRALRDTAPTVSYQSLPAADSQMSSLDINTSHIETRTVVIDITAPDEYQALWWEPQWACFGFLLKQTS